MRVLETKVVTTYSMGKKNKHKLRKSKENEASDSSEEITGKGCQHVNKAVNFNAMKKGLAKQVFGECAGCAKEASSKKSDRLVMDNLEGATSLDFVEETEPTLWVCLQCGHQGCGRNSPEKHSLKHYETPRSSQHNVVINTSVWSVWCYECDDELHPEKYKKVSECLEHIKKLAYVPTVDGSQGKNSSSGSGPSGGDSSSNKNKTHTGGQKVLGLSNLGNTCFFNAVLQNLIQTYSLENLLRDRKKGQSLKLNGNPYVDESCSSSDEGDNERNMRFHKDLPSIEISVSDPGPLTQALVVFLQDTSTKSGIISPSALFGQVCKKAPRFKGMQQQDSHELLRYLLDNMKTEEIKRGQTGILKHFKLSENTNPKKVDEETKTSVKVYGRQIKHTFVECLFGGQLISTVVCEECRHISQVLEPFLDLSLPVTEEKPQRPNQGHGARKRESTSDMKEDPAEDLPPKEEKISKHMSKKMKKQRKRDARRKSTKSSPKKDGSKEKDEEDQDDKEEEADEKEEEDDDEEGEGSKNDEQEEERDASDADVEDNLESDTSRYYSKTPSDSVFTTSGTIDESLTMESSAEPTSDKPGADKNALAPNSNATKSEHAGDKSGPGSTSAPQHSLTPNTEPAGTSEPVGTSSTHDCQSSLTCFTVETAIDNYTVPTDKSKHSLNGTGTPKLNGGPVLNGPANGLDSVNDDKEEISVSYTLQNGCLTETKCDIVNSTVTSYTVTDKTLCNGGGDSLDNVFTEGKVLDKSSKVCNGIVKNETEVKKSAINGEIGIQSHEEGLNDITEGISKISIKDSNVNNVTESCMNGDISVKAEIGNKTADSSQTEGSTKCNEIPDMSKLKISNNLDSKTETVKHGDNIQVTSSEINNASEKLTDSKCSNTGVEGKTSDTRDTVVGQCKSVSAHSGCHQNTNTGRWKELKWEGQRRSVNTLAERYHPSPGECSIESCLNQFTAAELLTGNNKFGCKNCTKLKLRNNPSKDKKESVYSNANKQYLIFQPPAVLTLHLKRFEQVGFSSRKVNRHVDFPFVLDIAPYCSSLTQGIKPGQKKILYSLYGVVEHSGRLTSGHYTAYVKVRPNIGTISNFLNVHNVTLEEYLHKYAQNVINGDTQGVDNTDFINTDSLTPPGRWYHISDSRVNEVTEASVEKAQAYILFYERIY